MQRESSSVICQSTPRPRTGSPGHRSGGLAEVGTLRAPGVAWRPDPPDAGARCDGEPPKAEQRVWPASSASSDNVQAWLLHLNASRYDVFVGMKSMRPLMRTGHTDDVLEVARVWLEIDEEGPKRLGRILGDARRAHIGMPNMSTGVAML